jgi:hypothetical protein
MTEESLPEVNDVEELISLVTVRDVVFHEVQARRSPDHEDADDLSMEITVREGQQELGVRCRAKVAGAGGLYTADAEAVFTLARPARIKPATLREFIEQVGVMVVYPYLRSAITDGAAKLSLRRPILKILRPGDIQLSGEERPVEGAQTDVDALPTVSDKLAAARARLQVLDQAVAADEVGRSRRLWGGAGWCVVTAMPKSHYDESLKYVVTPHAARLSWLVRALWAACRPLFDSMTKFEFFGRLGNAADRYQQRAGGGENARDLLGAVVHEAYEILSEVENGRFSALPVASRGVVYDDLLPDSERDDAQSVAEFEQWMKDRGSQ